MSSLKPCPQAEAIAQEIADNSGWSKRTDSYARIYQAALLGADRAFRAPIPVTDEMVERAAIAHAEAWFCKGIWPDWPETKRDIWRRGARDGLTAALGDAK